jgi:hypothetical protein
MNVAANPPGVKKPGAPHALGTQDIRRPRTEVAVETRCEYTAANSGCKVTTLQGYDFLLYSLNAAPTVTGHESSVALADACFPEQEIFARWPIHQQLVLFLVLFLVLAVAFYALGALIAANGFVGFDWVIVFSVGR